MRLQMYQVDAFASQPFSGNPAAVIPLQNWLDDAIAIATNHDIPAGGISQPRDHAQDCGFATA